MPVTAGKADVVISNCVLNLVPDKHKAFFEIFRVLKNGGHLSVSDVVLKGELPDQLKEATEMYAGCVSGAIQLNQYIGIIHQTGFSDIQIQKEKQILLPDDILLNYLSAAVLEEFKHSGVCIFSITVTASKI